MRAADRGKTLVNVETYSEWQSQHVGHGCNADPGPGLSPLPRSVLERLNVDHLSVGLGDGQFMWRSSLAPHQLIQWHRWPGHPYWVERQPNGDWRIAGGTGCRDRPGERFIRVGRVL